MGLGAEPLEFLLHLRALAPDAFEALLVVAQLLIEGLGSLTDKRRRENDVAKGRHEKTSRKTVVLGHS